MAKFSAVTGIPLLFLCFGVNFIGGQPPKINNDHLDLLRKMSENMDASIVERTNHHQKLLEEYGAQFKAVLQMDSLRHNELKISLERILESIVSSSALELGQSHLELIKNLAKKIEVSRTKDKQEFLTLQNQYENQQKELRTATHAQVQEIGTKRKEQALELREMIQKVLYTLSDASESCSKLYQEGNNISGIYRIQPSEVEYSFPVYCDMTDGGWTVIQRRGDFEDGVVNFNRSWNQYKNGFGNLNGEFWMGNEKIHLLTKTPNTMLSISVRRYNSDILQETKYNSFFLGTEEESYKLSTPVPTTGTTTNDPFYHLRGDPFKTYDHNPTCYNGAGWWYVSDCRVTTHLNGPRGNVINKHGVTFDGTNPVAFSTMKIKV